MHALTGQFQHNDLIYFTIKMLDYKEQTKCKLINRCWLQIVHFTMHQEFPQNWKARVDENISTIKKTHPSQNLSETDTKLVAFLHSSGDFALSCFKFNPYSTMDLYTEGALEKPIDDEKTIQKYIELLDFSIIGLAIDTLQFLRKYSEKIYASEKKFFLNNYTTSNHVKINWRNIIFHDKDVFLGVVSLKGSFLEHASVKLKKDKDVVIAALEKCPFSYQHMDQSLKNDPDVIFAAIKSCHEKNHKIPLTFIQLHQANPDFIAKLLTIKASFFRYADPVLKNDPNFIKGALTINPDVKNYI